MIAVLCGRTSIPAWTYWMQCPAYWERVTEGQWIYPRFAFCGLMLLKSFDNRPLPKYIIGVPSAFEKSCQELEGSIETYVKSAGTSGEMSRITAEWKDLHEFYLN